MLSVHKQLVVVWREVEEGWVYVYRCCGLLTAFVKCHWFSTTDFQGQKQAEVSGGINSWRRRSRGVCRAVISLVFVFPFGPFGRSFFSYTI